MRVGKGNSLLIPCSQDTTCIIWAELGDFWMEFEKFPVNFPVLAIKGWNAGRDRPVSFNYDQPESTLGHTNPGSALETYCWCTLSFKNSATRSRAALRSLHAFHYISNRHRAVYDGSFGQR